MARSYKKSPVFQDGNGTKSLQWWKRHANRKVRRTDNVPSGKAYRKVFETWTFRDYRFRETRRRHILKIEAYFKHFLILYGGIEETPAWFQKEHNDEHLIMWKKFYYWK